MPRLEKLQTFASDRNFDLTHPLDHEDVVKLASYWLPQIFFYPKERFHPVGMDNIFSMIAETQVRSPNPDARSVSKRVRTPGGGSSVEKFLPPVLSVRDGFVNVQVGNQSVPQEAYRILATEDDALDAMSLEELDGNDNETGRSEITHGANYDSSLHFFGAKETVSGGAVGADGDPFLPRLADDQGNRKIRIIVSVKNLLEALEFELAYIEEKDNLPKDGMRDGMKIEKLFFQPKDDSFPLTMDLRREVLRDMIAAHKAGDPIDTALAKLPPNWFLNKKAWSTLTDHVFVEYYLFYAFNDFHKYEESVFGNEHEGDDEGCCLVFDRNTLLAAKAADDMRMAVPTAIATSVHTEWQNADEFKHFAAPVPPNPTDPNWLPRDSIDVQVFVAAGSHATYLSSGDHDLVDFNDITGAASENPLAALGLALGAAIVIAAGGGLVLAALAAIAVAYEHFTDPEDHTSDEGIVGGPDNIVTGNPLGVHSELIFLPMSGAVNIYKPQMEYLLKLAAFPGPWGGDTGSLGGGSPKFEHKTGRYFRNVINKL